jgi:hypothetical protein
MIKHRSNCVKTRNYLWSQPVLPNKYLGFPTQITDSVNNNSVKPGRLQTFSQDIAVNFVRKLAIVKKLTRFHNWILKITGNIKTQKNVSVFSSYQVGSFLSAVIKYIFLTII